MLSEEDLNNQNLLSNVCLAVQTLYSQNESIPSGDKQRASSWLGELQQSASFQELPVQAHCSLRDSLLTHIAAVTVATDSIIVTQLSIAVADLVLQMSTWADPIGHLLNVFGSDSKHWWPLLEILKLLPEEVHSRKLRLGDNRRNQLINSLESASPLILSFLRQCLSACVNGPIDTSVFPVELCGIELVKCFGSWVSLNPECFCFTGTNDSHILSFAMMQLREGKCGWKMHSAATDCLCAVIEVLPNLESSSNNNAIELQNFQINLYTSINSLEEAYHYSVVEEDIEKTMNYCRIFTEYAESMVPYMLRSWRDPHYSIRVIDLVLTSAGHHDYEVAEVTYGFWYQLSEDLYHAHDDNLNAVFRPYIHKLIHCLYKHCKIEPDHEGPLTSSDEFYDFRKKSAELFQDVIFVVGNLETFSELAQCLLAAQSWEDQEAAFFLLHYTTKGLDSTNTAIIWPVVERILNWTEWQHVCLKISAVRFIGGMSLWLSENSSLALQRSMEFLVRELPNPQTNNNAAASLQSVCEACCEQIAAKHFDSVVWVVNQIDQYNVSTEAAVGLFKGVGHVLSVLPSDRLSPVMRQICRAQLAPLDKLVKTQSPNDRSYVKGSKDDPVYWLDRLSALFRSTSVPRKNYQGDHPCKPAICEDFWPVISSCFNKYQADVKLMERCCRSIRFAVRCIGKDSGDFLQPLVQQLVYLYNSHLHSCFLYLASILVDEFGSESQCVEGLLSTLEHFLTPTFNMFSQPNGLRNHPDTVDDFFRLCTRYVQRCPIQFLKSSIVSPLIQLATQAAQLDHREANIGVMKFLYDLVHAGRRHRDGPEGAECAALVKNILHAHAPNLVSTVLHAALFDLPSYTYPEICDFFHELKEFMPPDFAQWLESALKKLPDKTASGNQATTVDQLHDFHKKATNARSSKEVSKALKEFQRLFR
ncbi:unnamed protein product [Allacma fusca]|uniref:Exportin-1/Importin-beta-like domain-containing protein n=1 Tax=Allacma fusca TaxID=39272 RepID=A0A8J2PU19_9HEXA|nr:unnamed protein product [Allacma fusca]